MKRKAVSLLACLAVAGAAHGIGGTYLLDTKTGMSRPVVLSPVGKIQKPLSLRFDLNVDLYAGLNDFDRVVPGVWLSGSFRAADNLTVNFGPALEFNGGRVRCPGIMIGFVLQL